MRPYRSASMAAAMLTLAMTTSCGTANPGPSQSAASNLPVSTVEPTSGNDPPAAPHPCDLLPKADAEKLAGTRLEDAVAVQQTCTYTGPVTGPTAQVEVFVGDGAKKMLDIDRDTLGHEFVAVAGIGEEAHLEDGVVFFRKAAVWVAIRLVRLNDPAENRQPLQDAARAAAGRM